MLLTSLVLVPIIGILSIVINNKLSINNMKYIALTSSIINLFISLIIFILFDFSTNQFQFVQEYHNISYFDFYLGIDGLSIYFVLLTTIIIPISLLSNWKSIKNHVKSYIIIILLLESLLLLVFLVLDILLFYIFFESILPPLFILIGIFGSDNKIKASFYLFLYTLLGSLFLLLSILAMSSIMSATDFDTLFKKNFIYLTQVFLFYGIFIAFAVKTPTIFLNTWLLKAHVESPLGGSIILAAIVLKLSLYGILRLILPILPKAFMVYTYIIFLIGIITIIYASISTLRTIDVKELIAYSSVSHAAVYLIGIFSNSIQGVEGSITLGLGHGLVSPGLFIVAGGVLYDRFHTRLISFYKGMAQKLPLLALLFFILCLANCGAPLTLNFVGEFLSLYGVFERSSMLGVFASSSIVFSAAYTIYMYQRICFGGRYRLANEIAEDKIEEKEDNEEEYNFTSIVIHGEAYAIAMPKKPKIKEIQYPDLNHRESYVLITLCLLTILFGITPSSILDGLHYDTSSLIYFSYENANLAGFFSPIFIKSTSRVRTLQTLKGLMLVYCCVSYRCIEYIGSSITEYTVSRDWGLYHQGNASPQMEALVELHNNIMYYLVAILFAVGWIQAATYLNHNRADFIPFFVLFIKNPVYIITLFMGITQYIVVNFSYLNWGYDKAIVLLLLLFSAIYYIGLLIEALKYRDYIKVYSYLYAILCVYLIILSLSPENIICLKDSTLKGSSLVFDHVRYYHIVSWYLGLSMFSIGLYRSNTNKIGIVDNIIGIFNTIKKTPLKLVIFILGLFAISLLYNLLGFSVITKDYWTFLITIISKILIIKLTVSLILGILTKDEKVFYNNISFSSLFILSLIPTTLIYYFLVLPNLLVFKLYILHHIYKAVPLEILSNIDIRTFFIYIFNKLGRLFTNFNFSKVIGDIFSKWGSILANPVPEVIKRQSFLPSILTFKYNLSEFYYDRWLTPRSHHMRVIIKAYQFWKSIPKMSDFVIKPLVIPSGNDNSIISIKGTLSSLFNQIYLYMKNPVNLSKLRNVLEFLSFNKLELQFQCNSVLSLSLLEDKGIDVQITHSNGKPQSLRFYFNDLKRDISFYPYSINKDNYLEMGDYKNKLLDIKKPELCNNNLRVYMYNQSNYSQRSLQGGNNYIPRNGLTRQGYDELHSHNTVADTISSMPPSVHVQISTTKPSHKNLIEFSSERLIFRPLLASDVTAYLAIYKPEATLYNGGTSSTQSQSQMETFLQHTREYFLERKLIHYAMVGIFLKKSDGTEGELIGDGGVFSLDNEHKWPELYYYLKKEFWNKGYATEFVKKFLDVWWSLPRENTGMRVQPITLGSSFYHQEVKERLVAEINRSNKASIKVAEKAGFEFCGYSGGEQKYGYWRYISPN